MVVETFTRNKKQKNLCRGGFEPPRQKVKVRWNFVATVTPSALFVCQVSFFYRLVHIGLV